MIDFKGLITIKHCAGKEIYVTNSPSLPRKSTTEHAEKSSHHWP